MTTAAAWGLGWSVAATLVTAFLLWTFKRNGWRLVRLGKDPLTVVFLSEAHEGEMPWKLSSPRALGSAELAEAPPLHHGFPRPAEVRTWLINDLSAYEVGVTTVAMVWANRWSEPILISQVRAAILARSSRPHLSYFENPSGGELPIVKLGFDLDQAEPAALSLVRNDSGVASSTPFFADRVLTLSPGEQIAVTITGTITAGDCDWAIDVSTVVGRARFVQRITPPGRGSFRTAALTDRSAYRHAWITGLAVTANPSAQAPPYMYDASADCGT